MITARLLAVLAASSLAAVAYAQTQPAPSNQPTAAPGYNRSNPHERQMKSVGHETASPNGRSAPGSGLNTAQTGMRMAAAGPAGHPWADMSVQSRSGQPLGSVSKVVPGLNGRKSSGYVLVSGTSGRSVPVPYRTADSMVRDGKLVLSQSQFEHAPKVTQEDLRNRADHAWRLKADHYWMQQHHDQMKK